MYRPVKEKVGQNQTQQRLPEQKRFWIKKQQKERRLWTSLEEPAQKFYGQAKRREKRRRENKAQTLFHGYTRCLPHLQSVVREVPCHSAIT